jgi:hypothetical protein
MSDPAVNSDTPKAETESTPAPSTNQAGLKPETTTPAEASEPKADGQPSGESTEKETSQSAPEKQEKDVPETYDLKLPEGSLLDAGRIEEIALLAKEKGLSNEQAQLVLEREHAAVASFAERQMEQLKERQSEWIEAVKNDKELGGEALKENVEFAKRAIERFGSEALKNELNTSRLGDHPEVVRVFAKIGRAMANDSFVHAGAQATGKKRSHAEVLYGESSQ